MLDKKIDVAKKAKPTGFRFKGNKNKLGSKYYKRPENVLGERALENAKAKGLVYYDPRLNKGDVNQTRRFEGGGLIDWAWLQEKFSFKELFNIK